jgi:histidinol-phosphate aminotransferase
MENIIVGNGSDELLALATRAFVEPSVAKKRVSRSTVQFFAPSYSLYPVLANIHGATPHAVPLNPDFSIPGTLDKVWDFEAALTFVTTPNAPSGRGYSTAQLDALCQLHHGVLVLDEAYVDFAGENAMALALKHPHVLVSRTFSKAYSLCFQRVGYCVGHRVLIEAMHKVRDSYNVNGLGQLAAVATLADLGYYRKRFKQVIATRQRLSDELSALGFDVAPSQTNFVFVRPPRFPAEQWLQKLREQKILVRWFNHPDIKDRLRITIGTDAEADALVRVARKLLRQP